MKRPGARFSLWTVPDFRGKAKAMQARGGKLTVIDPRRTETAELTDQHLFIRPGGDAFLLLSIVHTLFADRRVRLGRLAEHVEGLAALEAAVADFAPERVAARCGIDAAAIRALAHQLAGAERAAVYGRIGTCTQEYGTLASWLIDVVNALTGHNEPLVSLPRACNATAPAPGRIRSRRQGHRAAHAGLGRQHRDRRSCATGTGAGRAEIAIEFTSALLNLTSFYLLGLRRRFVSVRHHGLRRRLASCCVARPETGLVADRLAVGGHV